MKTLQSVGIGGPGLIRLNHFGAFVQAAYGEVPYLVGSAATGKTWRDVDVRLILPDERFNQMFPAAERPLWQNTLFGLLCASISSYAEKMAGLPVDFQFQSQSDAEERYAEGVRVPLGIWTPAAE